MNIVERKIHQLVGDYPWLRKPIVDCYQSLLYLYPTNRLCKGKIHIFPGYFFGFHDKSPWDNSNTLHLAHRKYGTSQITAEKNRVGVGFFDKNHLFHELDSTDCWNWQQGAMTHWLRSSNHIVYNDFDKTPITKIINTKGDVINVFKGHTYCSNNQGTSSLSVDFSRFNVGAKEYGYRALEGSLSRIKEPKNDGIWSLELNSGKRKLEKSIYSLSHMNRLESMNNAYHFVTHLNFNSDDTYYHFIHRWRDRLGVLHSRFYIADKNHQNFRCFPLFDVSHISWDGPKNLIVYGWLTKTTSGYFSLNTVEMKINRLNVNLPNVDGHPQVLDIYGEKKLVTDTYPNRFREQKLYICNLTSGTSDLVFKAKIPLKFKHSRRCDYHPRWDRTGTCVSFDSAHLGERALCILSV